MTRQQLAQEMKIGIQRVDEICKKLNISGNHLKEEDILDIKKEYLLDYIHTYKSG